MKKTYATSMPNHIGAFLKASKCFAALGINITRVSYDNSVDSHMLFLDVEGTPEQAKYNQYAPILMTSVDTDPKLCAEERNAIMRRLGVGNWKIFGAHGAPKDYSVK